MRTTYTATLALLLTTSACDSNDDHSDGAAEASSGADSGSSGMDDGGANTGADESTGDTGSDMSTSDTGAQGCTVNTDCDYDEVCVTEACMPADYFFYEIVISRFEPASCADGFGGSEIYFKYFEHDMLTTTSSSTSCPAHWPNDVLEYDSSLAFQVDFWEADVIYDDLLASFCFSEGCGPIPVEYLHEGGWSGMAGDFYLDIEIYLVE